jgi:hypothetical protein
MESRIRQIEDFFDHYGKIFNRSLAGVDEGMEQTAELFAASFIGANPQGVNCGKNDHEFLVVMKQGYAFYNSIGITSMEIIAKEITILDDFHAMARISWRAHYIRKDQSSGSVDFNNIYFTQTRDGKPVVFAYITGDEQAALEAIGLV